MRGGRRGDERKGHARVRKSAYQNPPKDQKSVAKATNRKAQHRAIQAFNAPVLRPRRGISEVPQTPPKCSSIWTLRNTSLHGLSPFANAKNTTVKTCCFRGWPGRAVCDFEAQRFDKRFARGIRGICERREPMEGVYPTRPCEPRDITYPESTVKF